ncbi:MAG: hypothetical protein AAF709_21485 [Pseudomonadota bacterium]
MKLYHLSGSPGKVVSPRKFHVMLCGLALVFAAKIVCIALFAGWAPYWDQWGAEGLYLYKPYLEGTLSFDDFTRAHNEHRIMIPRLLDILVLELRGAWDTKLQMIVNSALCVLALGVLCYMLLSRLEHGDSLVFISFVTVFAAIPYSWENTLSGFQSQFHFVLLFSLLAIWSVGSSRVGSRFWLFGFACAWCAVFSSGSGSLTHVLLAVLSGLQYIFSNRRGWRELLGIAAFVASFIGSLALIVHVPGHDVLKAQGAAQFVHALVWAQSWPLSGSSALSWFVGAPAALVLSAPVVLIALTVLRDRPTRGDWRWLVVGLAGWGALQVMSLAYGRALSPVAPRYLDTIAINVIVGAAAVLWLIRNNPKRTGVVALGLVWFAVVIVGVGGQMRLAVDGAISRGGIVATHERNVRDYVVTGNVNALAVPKGADPHNHIPFPSPQFLKARLDDPTIRSILPPALNPQHTYEAVGNNLAFGAVLAGFFAGVRDLVLDNAWELFAMTAVSFALMLAYSASLALSADLRRRTSDEEQLPNAQRRVGSS